jgi:hypothetical protein
MKRSEMVESLTVKLYSDNCEGSLESFRETAHGILLFLENSGMLPPFSHEVFHKNWTKTRSGNCTGNEWEKEDETK